jgi:hypothetical protein
MDTDKSGPATANLRLPCARRRLKLVIRVGLLAHEAGLRRMNRAKRQEDCREVDEPQFPSLSPRLEDDPGG